MYTGRRVPISIESRGPGRTTKFSIPAYRKRKRPGLQDPIPSPEAGTHFVETTGSLLKHDIKFFVAEGEPRFKSGKSLRRRNFFDSSRAYHCREERWTGQLFIFPFCSL